MSRRDEYEQKAEAMLAPIVEEAGFELVDVVSERIHRQTGRNHG